MVVFRVGPAQGCPVYLVFVATPAMIVAHVGDVDRVLVSRERSGGILGNDEAANDKGTRRCPRQCYRRIARCPVVCGADVLWVSRIDATGTYCPATSIRAIIGGCDLDIGGRTCGWIDQIPDFRPVLGVVIVVEEVGKVLNGVEGDASYGPVSLRQVKDGNNGDQNCIGSVCGMFPRPYLLIILIG